MAVNGKVAEGLKPGVKLLIDTWWDSHNIIISPFLHSWAVPRIGTTILWKWQPLTIPSVFQQALCLCTKPDRSTGKTERGYTPMGCSSHCPFFAASRFIFFRLFRLTYDRCCHHWFWLKNGFIFNTEEVNACVDRRRTHGPWDSCIL